MDSKEYKGRRYYENNVGEFAYEIVYSRQLKKFVVMVTLKDGETGIIGQVESYLHGEILFHEWLAHNQAL